MGEAEEGAPTVFSFLLLSHLSKGLAALGLGLSAVLTVSTVSKALTVFASSYSLLRSLRLLVHMLTLHTLKRIHCDGWRVLFGRM